jgi:hypothetical protein
VSGKQQQQQQHQQQTVNVEKCDGQLNDAKKCVNVRELNFSNCKLSNCD